MRSSVAAADNRAINALRTVAAVLVVLNHTRALTFRDYADVPHHPGTDIFYVMTGLGHQAVIVFFVLSGFWVGGTVLKGVQNGHFSFADYAIRRLSRLWLVLLPGLILTAVCGILTLSLFGSSDVAHGALAYHQVAVPHLRSALGVVPAVGNLFFLQTIFVRAYGTNGALWSLAYEFWFYAIFPFAVVAIAGASWRRRSVAVLLLAGCITIAGAHILVYFPVWLLGAAVAQFQQTIRRRLAVARVMEAGRPLAAICLALALFGVRAAGLQGIGDAVVAVATAVLLCFLLDDVVARGVPGRALNAAGSYARASYSLYVIHTPVLALTAAAVLPRTSDRFVPGVAGYVVFATLAIGAVIAAWLFAIPTEFRTWRVRRWVAAQLGIDRAAAVSARRVVRNSTAGS